MLCGTTYEGELIMDHNMVVRNKMTEKYLLHELDPEVRDEFEEHYFDCRECAMDVRAGSDFVSHSKAVLAESSQTTPAHTTSRDRAPAHRAWFGWLRPAFAAPVLALMLAVIGYQNLVTYPELRTALKQPQVLPWASVTVGTYGAEGPTLPVPPGKGFLLFVRIPPDGTYSRYIAELHNPGGKLEWSLTIPANPGQDQWPVQIPGTNQQAGTYTVSVRGINAAGGSKDLGSTSFQLQILK
jgi:hypothetical protein